MVLDYFKETMVGEFVDCSDYNKVNLSDTLHQGL